MASSALSILPATPAPPVPPGPRGIRWIDIATAAGRSGQSERHIRTQCAQKWFAQGLARQQGPHRQWEVREDADPRLARIQFPDDESPDLKHLTTEQRVK